MTSAAMIGCFSKIYLSEVTVLKILELKSVPVNGKASVQFIRIDPEDISATLSEILKAIKRPSTPVRFQMSIIFPVRMLKSCTQTMLQQ